MRTVTSATLCLLVLPALSACVVKEKETVREQPVVEKRVEVREQPAPVREKVEVNVDR